MPVISQALSVKLFIKCMLYNRCSWNIFFIRIHSCPLERGEWFWNKERRTRCNLTLSIPLILRNLVITSGDSVSKFRNGSHIFFRLCRKSKHEIKLYLIPAAIERLSGTSEDIILCKPFIDHITHTLWSCLRCKRQTAFANILYFRHYIQRKRINTQRRQRNIYPFVPVFIDQPIY